MKHRLYQNMLRVLYIMALCALLLLPSVAAEAEDIRIQPTAGVEAEGPELESEAAQEGAVEASRVEAGSFVPHTTGSAGIELIKKYEGFSARAYHDYSQYTIGYGTNYDFAVSVVPELANSGTITEEQATLVLQKYLEQAEAFLNGALKGRGISVNQNQFDALISFTYNVGSGWWYYQNTDGSWCLLRQMLEDSAANWTSARTQAAFGSWVNAGGQRLEGLVTRRAEEAQLFGTAVQPEKTAPVVQEEIFPDVVKGKWYYTFVVAAYDQGLLHGYDTGLFGPDDSITRGQMVQALANYAKAESDAYNGPMTAFSDVKAGEWYAQPIYWANSKGLLRGNGQGGFSPEEAITRQDLCAIIARYLQSLGIAAPAYGDTFLDDSDISDYAKEGVYYCASLGIVQGVGDGRFEPISSANRGQLAKIMVLMNQIIAKNT